MRYAKIRRCHGRVGGKCGAAHFAALRAVTIVDADDVAVDLVANFAAKATAVHFLYLFLMLARAARVVPPGYGVQLELQRPNSLSIRFQVRPGQFVMAQTRLDRQCHI